MTDSLPNPWGPSGWSTPSSDELQRLHDDPGSHAAYEALRDVTRQAFGIRRAQGQRDLTRELIQLKHWQGMIRREVQLEDALEALDQAIITLKALLFEDQLLELGGGSAFNLGLRAGIMTVNAACTAVHQCSELQWNQAPIRLDRVGLKAAGTARPESRSAELIRALAWRQLSPEERAQLRRISVDTGLSLGGLSGVAGLNHRAVNWSDWLHEHSTATGPLGPIPRSLSSLLLTWRTHGAQPGTRAAKAAFKDSLSELKAWRVPPTWGPDNVPVRWGAVMALHRQDRHKRASAALAQRCVDLMRGEPGYQASWPADRPEGDWKGPPPGAGWYLRLNRQRAEAGLKPYPRFGLNLPGTNRTD